MLTIVTTNQFERDVKKMKKRGKNIFLLENIVSLLAHKKSLPEKCRPHLLSNDYQGCWDAHIQSDWILIYETTPTHLYLARTGSHSDLFK